MLKNRQKTYKYSQDKAFQYCLRNSFILTLPNAQGLASLQEKEFLCLWVSLQVTSLHAQIIVFLKKAFIQLILMEMMSHKQASFPKPGKPKLFGSRLTSSTVARKWFKESLSYTVSMTTCKASTGQECNKMGNDAMMPIPLRGMPGCFQVWFKVPVMIYKYTHTHRESFIWF